MNAVCRVFYSVQIVIFSMDKVNSEVYPKTRKPCSPGYVGSDCNVSCRFPNYGFYCQLRCNCSENYCHHIRECQNSTCPAGYYGPTCNQLCRYLSYGGECQLECRCDQKNCHFIKGCQHSNVTRNTTEAILNITTM